ncbi:P protein-like [Drosophila busckii]|uniref:P protein-like n=1 Tax=Drosophila busckii TaxID=30019 RepID=UPI00083EF8B3|nr:P protein-like [Drosophila busckii]
MASTHPHASHARRSYHLTDDDELTEEQQRRHELRAFILSIVKICVFVAIWIFFSIVLMIFPPHDEHQDLVPLVANKAKMLKIAAEPSGNKITLTVKGNIDSGMTQNPKRADDDDPRVAIWVQCCSKESNDSEWESAEWLVFLGSDGKAEGEVTHEFKLSGRPMPNKALQRMMMRSDDDRDNQLYLSMTNKKNKHAAALAVHINTSPLDISMGVICAVVILTLLYVLIILDITDRAFAALLCASIALATLALMGLRPTLNEIILWIDWETMMLLFGMMIICALLSETGVFDYLSVVAYRVSKGRPWMLIFLLSMLTVFLSAFLDNVTIVLLMVPVTIRLCENMGLRTTKVLIVIAIFSNIGGTLTPVGDPPNVIIATNSVVQKEGVNFLNFLCHMLPGVAASILVTWFILYFMLKDKLYAGSDEEMRESLRKLQKTAEKNPRNQVGLTYSEEQMRVEVLKRIEELKDQYRRKQDAKTFGLQPARNYIETLADMESRYKIKNKPLLIKCTIVLIIAVLLFSLNSFPFMAGMTLAWAAILCAFLLLILHNKPDMDIVLEHIEWSTLIFFAGLFVLMEALSEMGLIQWIADRTIDMILRVDKDHQIVVGITLMMWISAITSAFVDNIPIVSMMLKLAIMLASNDELHLPLPPLLWALSYGVCFGGNSSLIAATSNVVAAGVARQYGYKIGFLEFLKYGAPITLITDAIATVYLLIAHGLLSWNTA